MKRRCLILFVKSPESGNVKSRLSRSIGKMGAAQLYRCFVLDLLDALDKGAWGLHIFFHPPDAGLTVKKWLGEDRSYAAQEGEDLGERMKRAFEESFAGGSDAAILIGSDLPDLPREIIETGFVSLLHHDVVMGPALDGGYYLIGFKRESFAPDVFDGISWGSGTVFRETCQILSRKGRRFSVLPPWQDIDTYEDLQALIARHGQTPFAGSRTIRYALSQHWPLFNHDK